MSHTPRTPRAVDQRRALGRRIRRPGRVTVPAVHPPTT